MQLKYFGYRSQNTHEQRTKQNDFFINPENLSFIGSYIFCIDHISVDWGQGSTMTKIAKAKPAGMVACWFFCHCYNT